MIINIMIASIIAPIPILYPEIGFPSILLNIKLVGEQNKKTIETIDNTIMIILNSILSFEFFIKIFKQANIVIIMKKIKTIIPANEEVKTFKEDVEPPINLYPKANSKPV